jgi:hypothetical protein
VEHREDGGIGDDVELVLPWLLGAGTPLARAKGGQGASLRGCGHVEQRQDVVGRHRVASTVTIAL